jgi:amino acid transporter
VVLMMLYGQTRILFTMARDGLLPQVFSRVHSRFQTPHVITIFTGVFVAFFAAVFPVDELADISNAGTLFAFALVALGVMILRRTEPSRSRPFRAPLVWLVGPAAIAGCGLLFFSLGFKTIALFLGWAAIGIRIYAYYGRRNSLLAYPVVTSGRVPVMKPLHYLGLIVEFCIGVAILVLVVKSSLSDSNKVLVMGLVALVALVVSLLAPFKQQQVAAN